MSQIFSPSALVLLLLKALYFPPGLSPCIPTAAPPVTSIQMTEGSGDLVQRQKPAGSAKGKGRVAITLNHPPKKHFLLIPIFFVHYLHHDAKT